MEATTNTSTEPAATTTAATGAAAAADPAPASSGATTEGKFATWLKDILAGKQPDGDGGDKSAAAKQPESYTKADLDKLLGDAKAKWEKELSEKAQLDKLPAEDKVKAEQAATAKQLAELQQQLAARELKDAALKDLEAEGFPSSLAELVDCSNQENEKKSLELVKASFKASLADAIKEKLKGKTPEGLGAASGADTEREAIAKAIRGGIR